MRIAAFDGEVYTRCPMGKDGTKLLPGDTVYGEDGREWKLKAIGPTFCYAGRGREELPPQGRVTHARAAGQLGEA